MITVKTEEGGKPVQIKEEKDWLTPMERKFLQRPLKLPVGYLSPSQIDLYLSCPMKYKHRYVDKKKGPAVLVLEEGSSIHAALEHNNRYKIARGKDAPVKEIEEIYCAELKVWKGLIEDWGDDTPAKVETRGRGLIRAYMRDFAPRFTPKHAERLVTAWVGPVPIVGVIDAEGDLGVAGFDRTKRPTIVDYKTVKKMKSEAELANSIQLGFYGYVWRKENKTADCQVGYCNLLKPKGTVQWQGTDVTDERIAWMRRVILSVADAISAGVFPLTNPLNWMCQPKYCEHYYQCRGCVSVRGPKPTR